ncbi:MAG: PQQ-like beta-propeller repeat protein [Planctomycetota bacterium]|nr:PQQ-like beta-propeller repeat protein [Planctomycetota bacterium]
MLPPTPHLPLPPSQEVGYNVVTMFDAQPTDTARSRFWRWASLIALLVLGGGSLLALARGWIVLSYKPSREVLYAWAAFELGLLVWIIVVSPFSPRNRVKATCLFCLCKSLLWMLVYVEGYYGDGRPVFAWRFSAVAAKASPKVSHRIPDDLSPPPIDTAETHTDYPGFRGIDRSGIVSNIALETDWETHPPELLWRRPVGTGWSSFAIADNAAVTQEQQGDDEVVACYHLLTGSELWSHRDRTQFREVTGGDGPRATPTVHAGRVFSLGATGILNCLDLKNGTLLWSRNILDDAGIDNRIFGMAGSPLVVGTQVIVSPGGKNSTLVSYDTGSGNILWQGGDADASYSSPQWAPFAAGDQILIFHASGLSGHDTDTGERLWDHTWISQPQERNNVCQPIPLPGFANRPDHVFLASGYGQGCALLDVKKFGDRWSVAEVWHSRNLKAKFSSAVKVGEYVYGMDEAILTCVDLTTGERKWKRGRYGYGQLICVGDVLLIQEEQGEIVLVAADPHEFRELARMRGLHDRTWNHPAFAAPYLLVRNDREAACFRLPVLEDRRPNR